MSQDYYVIFKDTFLCKDHGRLFLKNYMLSLLFLKK